MEPTKRQSSNKAYWLKHIKGWQDSGLTQTDYCAKHQIAIGSFWRWKRKLGLPASLPTAVNAPSSPPPSGRLVPVSIFPENPINEIAWEGETSLRLHVRDGYSIEVGVGFHLPTLQRLLAALG